MHTGIDDAALLRCLAEDVPDMAPEVRNQLRHIAEVLAATPPAAPAAASDEREALRSALELAANDLREAMVEVDAALAARAPQAAAEFETRADGETVRADRWQVGIRRIVALLWGNRHEFEVDEVVEAVRKLIPHPHEGGDDESLVRAVLEAAPQPTAQAEAGTTAAARRMYAKWCDEQGIHSNRLPSWPELSDSERVQWLAKAQASASEGGRHV